MRKIIGWIALLTPVVLSIGCGGTSAQPGPAVQPTTLQQPTPTSPAATTPAQPARTLPPGSPTPIQTPAPRSLSPADTAAEAARAELARRINAPADQIQVVSIEQVDWPDASLGCPQPGQMYIQVITPGYKVILAAGGQRYEVHTDLRGRAVMCR